MPFRHWHERKSNKQSNEQWGKIGLHANHSQTYHGQWLNHQKHGYGKLQDRVEQSIYEGEFVRNKKHGCGRLTRQLKDGTMQRSYVGQWRNNQMNGLGTLYSSQSAYYEGEFVNNQKCGWGRMFYDNGNMYEGQWLNDKRHGFGLFLAVNGDRYEGNWFEDEKDGLGRYYFFKAQRIFEGIWVKNICKSAEQKEHETSASQKT